jgi:hypothetical protein
MLPNVQVMRWMQIQRQRRNGHRRERTTEKKCLMGQMPHHDRRVVSTTLMKSAGCSKYKQLSAGHYISNIQSDHHYFDLQLICLFEEGKQVSGTIVR